MLRSVCCGLNTNLSDCVNRKMEHALCMCMMMAESKQGAQYGSGSRYYS